ncbi:GDP-mannose:phosphatidyl-myo-inositol alpha-1,2-mannosyltransferase [Bifidobacterium actinocoloniiforme DSM 22766]|uniref:GDP-mannose:phosphatidyl-myo-inositol alpha-1,2-mannosyltransferase n=1 Tax=Bifidobacterium actinocoloniiforme DSM 22766 TaxID=1437605 RepID=A0A086Z0H4_9BIFI|nr:glycosyltransferase family 4 protein [Bifidobacterium actinocoloniiforme]AKV55251.1 glycosyl transferase [Bifidobacterium actinocoloniiforme DSM 22766]KFI40024.1 GDP-mannose:phosphatidyl-myo-inositol alpha-1,2-mannosyltransferase [Bifidobacterium actinocoloniiforme DSM 22766]
MRAHDDTPVGEPDPLGGRKLRVGIISPYSFETPGGVQLHIRDFAQQLIALGHEVEVLAPGRRTPDMPAWVHTTGSSFSVPYNGSVANLSYFGLAGRRTREWVRQGRFDVLHLHEPEVPSLSHKPLAPGFDPCPYVATFHASFDSYPLALKLASPYLRSYLSGIRQAICVSEAARDTAGRYLNPATQVQVIPNGIRASFFAAARPKPAWRGSAKRPVIGFLGRMGEERKGFKVFAQAAQSLLEIEPNARFLCAGDGQDSARQIARQVQPGLEDRMEFLGRVSDEEKASFYKSLDVYVAPQTGGESFGIVLAEAMAAGCPVVASDLEAFEAVSQRGCSALHFHNGDGRACAQRIASLLSDPTRREALAKAGLERSRTYDWQQVTTRILTVYAKAMQPTPSMTKRR